MAQLRAREHRHFMPRIRRLLAELGFERDVTARFLLLLENKVARGDEPANATMEKLRASLADLDEQIAGLRLEPTV